MAAEKQATPPLPGELLKQLLTRNGVLQRDAARLMNLGGKTLWRIFVGQRALDRQLAEKFIAKCGLSEEAAEQLLAAVEQHSGRGTQAEARSGPARTFGKFLAGLRKKHGRSVRYLAAELGQEYPNLVAIETGRSVPSPLLAQQIARKLGLANKDASEYFRLLADALVQHSAVAKYTSVPALCSLAEWVLFSQGEIKAKSVTVGQPVSTIPNPDKAITLIQQALSEASKQFESQARSGIDASAARMASACIQHEDGRVTVILPIAVTL